MLSGQESDDRDPCITRSAPGGPGVWRYGRRLPADHDPVVFGDLVHDLDVEARMGAVAAGNQPANALWSGHVQPGAGEVADVVGGYQLVDELQPSFVPHRFDEQPDLQLVELADAVHLAIV